MTTRRSCNVSFVTAKGEGVNSCGGSGSDYEPALNKKLDAMLAIIQPTQPVPVRSAYEPVGLRNLRGNLS